MKFVLGLVCLLLVAACGKTETLTAEQKATLKETSQSVNRSMNAAASAESTRRTRSSVTTAKSLDENETQMYQRLLKYENCKMNYKTTQLTNPKTNWFYMNDTELDFNFTGECPVDFNLHLTTKVGGQSYKVGGKWFYLVKDEEYKKYNDITGIDISGYANLMFVDDNSSVKNRTTPNLKMTGTASVTGTLTSNKYSKIDFNYNYLGRKTGYQQGSVEQKLTLSYPGFKAELKQVGAINGNVTTYEYFLNEEKVTEAEYNDCFGYNFATKAFINN